MNYLPNGKWEFDASAISEGVAGAYARLETDDSVVDLHVEVLFEPEVTISFLVGAWQSVNDDE